MQSGNYATQVQDHNTGTAYADYRIRKAKRAEAKRQRFLDTVQMLAETVFLGGALVAGYWVLHMALWLI